MHLDEYGIDVYVYPDGTPYYVRWDSIRNAEELADWLAHLRKKRWWTDAMDFEFRDAVKHMLGIEATVGPNANRE